jgi:hypothetical protein
MHAQNRHQFRTRMKGFRLSHAAFPKGTGNGHHLVNKSSATAVYLDVGSRNPHDLAPCSDIDMMSSNADGRFVHKDGALSLVVAERSVLRGDCLGIEMPNTGCSPAPVSGRAPIPSRA